MSRCQALHPQSWEGVDSKNSKEIHEETPGPAPAVQGMKKSLYTCTPFYQGDNSQHMPRKEAASIQTKKQPLNPRKETRVGLELPSSHENTKLKLTAKQPSTEKIWTYQEDILYAKTRSNNRMAGGVLLRHNQIPYLTGGWPTNWVNRVSNIAGHTQGLMYTGTQHKEVPP